MEYSNYKYNNQEVIICDNCKKMYYYDKFIWICPCCKEIIQDNEKETKSKIIGFLKDENLTKGKYSTIWLLKFILYLIKTKNF